MPTYPIILAHGIARFDILRQRFVQQLRLDEESLPDRLHYFRKIGSHLERHGFEVYHTTVGFAKSVEGRARDLKAAVERVLAASGHEKVHIIAHSMGGLDTRHMIVDLGMAERVCSLTTVGTPHRGSSFADWGREHRGAEAVQRLEDLIDLNGFLNLTSADCAAFNARAEADEADNSVFYQTYTCWEEERDRVFTPLQFSWGKIKEREADAEDGLNDGLVSVVSQRWTKVLRGAREKEVGQHDFPVLGDHLNEIGWWEVHQLSGKFRLGTLLNPFAAVRSLLDDRREYESQIQGTYLSVAEDLRDRFPV